MGKRIYQWVLAVAQLIETLPRDRSTDIIARQLLRSAPSVGANYVEGQAGSSRKDFTNYVHHSLKSANESKFWLALLRDLKKAQHNEVRRLLDELVELSNMLGATLRTLKSKD